MTAVLAIAGWQRCASPLERGDLRCAVCALPAPAAGQVAQPERARVLRCRECNAAIAFSPEAQAPRCAFCGAVMAVEQPIDPVVKLGALDDEAALAVELGATVVTPLWEGYGQ